MNPTKLQILSLSYPMIQTLSLSLNSTMNQIQSWNYPMIESPNYPMIQRPNHSMILRVIHHDPPNIHNGRVHILCGVYTLHHIHSHIHSHTLCHILYDDHIYRGHNDLDHNDLGHNHLDLDLDHNHVLHHDHRDHLFLHVLHNRVCPVIAIAFDSDGDCWKQRNSNLMNFLNW